MTNGDIIEKMFDVKEIHGMILTIFVVLKDDAELEFSREWYEAPYKAGKKQEPKTNGNCINKQAVIEVLNTMDRYVSEELTLCDTNKKFPANEVFVVDDVYEKIVEQLPSAQHYQSHIRRDDMTIEDAKQRLLNTAWLGTNEDRETTEEAVRVLIKAVEQQPKTGHWIYDRTRDWDGECKYECSECGMGSDVDYAYCMRCGAKMESEARE